MNWFNIDNPIINGLARVTDILILNFLWIICCLPIVTIGASTTALYYCMLKIVRDSDSGIVGMFFRSFRQNLKQSCILTVLFLLIAILLYFDFMITGEYKGGINDLLAGISIVVLVIYGVIVSYTFPLLAQFENTIRETLKNAFFIGFSNIKKTIVILLLNSLPIILFLKLPELFVASSMIWLMFGVAFVAYINSRMLVKIFNRLIEETKNEV